MILKILENRNDLSIEPLALPLSLQQYIQFTQIISPLTLADSNSLIWGERFGFAYRVINDILTVSA